jgi:hypothetical protein
VIFSIKTLNQHVAEQKQVDIIDITTIVVMEVLGQHFKDSFVALNNK